MDLVHKIFQKVHMKISIMSLLELGSKLLKDLLDNFRFWLLEIEFRIKLLEGFDNIKEGHVLSFDINKKVILKFRKENIGSQ